MRGESNQFRAPPVNREMCSSHRKNRTRQICRGRRWEGRKGREGFCELKISFGVGTGEWLHHGLRFIKGESPDGHVIASMGTDEMKVSRVK